MNKKIVLYSVVIGAPLSIKTTPMQEINQECYSQDATVAAEIHPNKNLTYQEGGYDEFDMLCNQLNNEDFHLESSHHIADWAASLAITAIMHYYSFKEFMSNSWQTLKEKIVRK